MQGVTILFLFSTKCLILLGVVESSPLHDPFLFSPFWSVHLTVTLQSSPHSIFSKGRPLVERRGCWGRGISNKKRSKTAGELGFLVVDYLLYRISLATYDDPLPVVQVALQY